MIEQRIVFFFTDQSSFSCDIVIMPTAYHHGVKKRPEYCMYIESCTQRIAVCKQAHTADICRSQWTWETTQSRIQTISTVCFRSHRKSQSPRRLVRVSRRLLLQVPREGLWQSGFLDWLHCIRNYIGIYCIQYVHICFIPASLWDHVSCTV